jgi:hypothetical protein
VRGTTEPQADMKEHRFGRKKFSIEYLGTLKQKQFFGGCKNNKQQQVSG